MFPRRSQESLSMTGKPVLHYLNGRGRMESIRWLLAAAGVEFEEKLFENREEFEKLIQGGTLMYGQVPMVEMDGMNLVQTRAILRYIAAKYGLYGRNLEEQAWIDMYVEGLRDLSDMIMFLPLSLPEEKEMNHDYVLHRAMTRFFPVYEKALRDNKQHYLVGNRLSWADVQLLEVILMAEECKASVLSGFPHLQDFKVRTSQIPTINRFLQPGSQRKPPLDAESLGIAKDIFKFEQGMFLKNMSTVVAEY
ncbi:glutathione S-transferase-like isoform X2 [Alexandromys fortis]|uniref:glutathione S-transferase-like isoform X2 n=1 Tax=Alexandromys fortis TaxID=100897 RepID=UPI0021536EEE|nr:glutathione S-transferase-like isoform X2 [Microtus fortis]XP_049980037.1 glutathione S-transferase-like isoform X2 [Microtus fortis]XP_049980039.1 glutathione S-transferase-like isoform X2 [Microtus fortis]XP_049980040.1 glutathione S-transferase-like isoform X2 [Microtus fortis]XP_049980041.1 glutathione S-transferase-like isoform X2 [Microtus fortis]XP_049980042.1 glutathione S-transferase-like isoform X2 [Microtus fortis]XP_049980043.1 glutathione S-transferase-like isoform X2 [Microtu